MQRIPSSSCEGKETVEIDILVTPRNGDRKIMQSIRITSRPSLKKKEVKPVEPVHKNIYQSNTYRQDLSWLHFDDEGSREAGTEGPTVLHTRFCSLSNNSK